MREKELRLAVVLFGGISLAVYMHGVSKEFLKLVRASASLHGNHDRRRRASATFEDVAGADPGSEFDTERVYFDLLRAIGAHVDLRVVIDIVAGASAGGINGVMLARALSHNLTFGALRDQWLADADVTNLLAAERRARPWSKAFMRPVLWLLERSRLLLPVADEEVRRKLSLFVRSRWFSPPFDGRRMSELMLDGARSLVKLPGGHRSLLPAGQSLELFVTLTDYHGYRRNVQLHDPPQVEEREHRHVLRFACQHWPGGDIASDFDTDSAPALAFAARATSAFPGAFPPATLAEMDRLLTVRGIEWPGRRHFIDRGFAAYTAAGADPQRSAFLDGAVLNNKPFREAIRAIQGRPAYREVERRLVYVDPSPPGPVEEMHRGIPSFFPTLKAALSDLPRSQPIGEELKRVATFNEQVRLLQKITAEARPQVTELVDDLVRDATDRLLRPDEIRARRMEANNRVARNAGLAYDGYVQMKLAATIEALGHRVAAACGVRPASRAERSIVEVIAAWAAAQGIAYVHAPVAANTEIVVEHAPAWLRFLIRFDDGFRKRRLAFLIQGQNRLYATAGDRDGAVVALVNDLKREFYLCLDSVRRREQPEALDHTLSQRVSNLFAPLLGGAPVDPDAFATSHGEAITLFVDGIGRITDMELGSDMLDATLAGMDPAVWPVEMRHEIMVNYFGFPFWDLLTFSVAHDAGEFNEIKIDRLSPREARPFVNDANLAGFAELKGIGLGHFAAFFSRAYRENDYLRGRLHAAVRLIDIVADVASEHVPAGAIDWYAFKHAAMRAILDAEEPHLPAMSKVIADLRTQLAPMADPEL